MFNTSFTTHIFLPCACLFCINFKLSKKCIPTSGIFAFCVSVVQLYPILEHMNVPVTPDMCILVLWDHNGSFLQKFLYICDALTQNREQVTFWVQWVSDIFLRRTLTALIWCQNQVHTPTFGDIHHLCINP